MEMKRRGFLASASTVGAACLLQPVSLLAQVTTAAVPTLEDYRAREGELFYVSDEDALHQGQLGLATVKDNGTSDKLQQFTLILAGQPGAAALPEGRYSVSGESFDLFLKHSGSIWGIHVYSAEFALLV